MKVVLSGIQPTGELHIGNYFGAVQNWVRLQEQYQCYFCVVDYHAMTAPYTPEALRQNTWKMVFYLLACGIKAENLFIQSQVPEHTELAWILGCVTSYGELTRMTQFKDKVEQLKTADKDALISVGLFTYPVLQVADILLYRAHYVPVGKDQEQHLELARNTAERFNCQFQQDYFPLPEPLFTPTAKILSPADPTRKMSKSLGPKHYIKLFGEPDDIRRQIRSAVTDTGQTPSDEMSPGVANLFEILRACGRQDAYEAFMGDYRSGQLRYKDLKETVSDALVALTTSLRERLQDIASNEKQVKAQLEASSCVIRARARQTLNEVREIVGLSSFA